MGRPPASGHGLSAGDLKRWTLGLCLAYTLFFGGYLLATGAALAWPLLLIPPLLAYQWHTSSRTFWVGWLPLSILLLHYLSLGAFSAGLDPGDVHVRDLIAWERALFGGIPAAALQRLLMDSVYTQPLDWLANGLYLSHFLVPALIGWALWRQDELEFWKFFLGFFLLSYAAFLTYLFFPAAPPWWASRQGYLADLERVTLEHFVFADFAANQAPNPVAAVPSLHCAYPFLYAISSGPLFRRWRLWFLGLTLGVLFSVLYLGHHWAIDAGAGYAYAGTAILCRAGLSAWCRRS